MSSYTPNLNLYKPAGTDDYSEFLTEFNNNMDKIDQGGGGGGSSTLAGLTDVSLSAPADAQVLKYNISTQKWENANESSGGGGGTTYTLTEQVVGTWLGKPLYQIVIPFNGINLSANAWYLYNISSYLTNPEIVFPQKDMSYYIVSNVERLFSEISYESPNLLLKTPVARTNISGHVVVRYTKTTD